MPETPVESGLPSFVADGGELSSLMRAHDWSTSPLGPPQGWPQSLRSVVGLLLGSKFPMFVAWGPGLGFLYNDAYAEILGAKHPRALGGRFRDIWPEIWPDISSLVDAALAGEATYRENLPLTLNRQGFDEQTWFTFSYSPLRDESGRVAGMYCACSETTGQVLAEQRLTDERERQRKLFEQAPGFITILSGPELRFEFVNEAYDRLFGRRGFVGKTVREAFPDLEGQPFFELLENAFATGERSIASATSIRLQATPDVPPADCFLDFIYEPVLDENGAVTGLFVEGHDVTERVRAEQRRDALLRLNDRLRDVADTADLSFAASELLGGALGAARVGYGSFDPDATTIVIERDWCAAGFGSVAGLHQLADYGSHGDDLRRGLPVVNADVETDPRTREYPGPLRALEVAAFLDVPIVEGGRTVAQMFVHSATPRAWTAQEVDFVRDVAERTRAAIARRSAEQALTDAEHRLKEAVNAAGLSEDFRALFEASPTPFLVVAPPDWTIVAANHARLRVTGMSREAQIGRKLFDLFPDDPNDPTADGVRNLTASFERVVASRASDAMAVQRYAVRETDGRFVERWWSPVNSPVLNRSGDVALIIHRVEDVTETVRLRGEAGALDQLARDQQAVIDRLRASEAALRESEARFRLMADAVPQIVWITDRHGRMEFLNKQFVDYTGASGEAWTAAELAAKFMHADDGAKVVAAFEAALAAGEPFEIEHRIRSAAGNDRWFLARAEPNRDPQTGQIARWFGASVDIHDRREAETALRASEEFNRRILASSADCIKVLDLEGRLEFMSEGGKGVMEVEDFAAIQGACWPDFWPGEENAKALAAVEEAKRGGTGRFQGFATTMKGTPRWWDVAVTPINGLDGTPEKLLSVSRDVTSTREAQAALRASEARFEAIANSIDQMIWSTRSDGFHDYYNQRWYEYTGVPEGSTDGEAWNDMFHPEDQEQAWRLWRHSLATGQPYHIEYRLRHRSGEYRWVIGRAQCVRDERGRIARWFGTCTDIHEIVEAREVLTRSRKQLEHLITERTAERNRVWEMSRDLFAIMGFDGQLKAINPAWETTFGRDEATLLSLSFREQVHPDDHGAVQAMMERLLRGETVERFEDRIRHAGGGWRWISWTLVPEGDVFYAVGRDVTVERERQAELEAAQEALRQSQKMEAMGSLTGGVAHDFNNLLTPIIGSLDMLVRKGVGSERERRLIDGALQSAERAKTLVQRLLAFARRQPLQPTAVDVARLVDGMAGLIGSTLGPTIDVRVDLATDLPPANADLNQLEMALLNLAVNARDAMPHGGTLTISARRESVNGRHSAKLKPGHYVLLCVADTGVGMDHETLARAVEPFFSTKGIGRGTGLGLSMVHGLAAQLGGGITIDSAPGRGTNIELWLPISAAVVGEDDYAVPAGFTRANRGTALLVDDEELVRMSTADMLVDLGFDVVEAATAEEALHLIKGGMHPDLLVTDHLMPGMNGADLAREARALKPALPVLVVSGYAEVDGIAPEWPRLIKPFRNAELATSVAALIPLSEG